LRKLLVLFLSIFFTIALFSESVLLDEVIDLSVKNKSNLVDFVLGKKKSSRIRPFAIFRYGKSGYCIIDQVNSTLLFYNNNWKLLKRVKKIGKKNFVSPVSGTMGENNSILIADSSHREIIKLSPNLRYEKIFFFDPVIRITGIYFFRGKIYAVDTANHAIIIFDSSGKKINQFGIRGVGNGEFNFPTHLFVDEKHIFVNDALNFRIQVFDHEGNFISKFGRNGKYGGDFSKPKGIAVDSKKRIFVSDVMFDNVQIFDMEGMFLSYFGGPGVDRGKFWMPSGLMIDEVDRIYVCDTYNSRIQIFRISEENSEKVNLD